MVVKMHIRHPSIQAKSIFSLDSSFLIRLKAFCYFYDKWEEILAGYGYQVTENMPDFSLFPPTQRLSYSKDKF